MGSEKSQAESEYGEFLAARERRTKLEIEADPDELLAQDSAEIADLMTRHGLPGDFFSAPDEWVPPPRLEHHRELVSGWIGRTPRDGELLADAFEIMGPMAVWCALALLEEPEHRPQPTASLNAKIDRYRSAHEVLGELVSELSILTPLDDGNVACRFPVELVQAARVIENRIASMESTRNHRQAEAKELRKLYASARGQRGKYSPNQRMAGFVEACEPLVRAKWSWHDLARLVLDSRLWVHPPCQSFANAALDNGDHDESAALRKLARRLNKAKQRAK